MQFVYVPNKRVDHRIIGKFTFSHRCFGLNYTYIFAKYAKYKYNDFQMCVFGASIRRGFEVANTHLFVYIYHREELIKYHTEIGLVTRTNGQMGHSDNIEYILMSYSIAKS